MKNKKHLMSLRAVFILLSAIIIVLVLTIVTAYSAMVQSKAATTSVKAEIQSMAESTGRQLKVDMEVAMDASRTLAYAVGNQNASTNPLSREDLINMLQKVITNNPTFFGISTAWEPNTFDAKDNENIGVFPSDASGRFIPYWYRNDQGKPELTILVDYETPGVGDYYLIPKATLQEVVIEPYLYPINGVDVALTSLMVPVKNNEKFVGVVGVDFKLDSFQQRVDSFDFYDGAAKMYILSNQGLIVGASGKPELIGKSLEEAFTGEDDSELIANSQKGEITIEEEAGSLKVNVPFYLGLSPDPWSVLITVPMKNVLQESNDSLKKLIFISTILLIAALIIIWFVTGSVTRPLKVIEKAAKVIEGGELKWDIPQKELKSVYQTFSEISSLATSLDISTKNMIEKVVWYEGILDSIPFPLSVTDMDMNWTFINKPTEGLLGITRAQARGTQCKNWQAGICETLDCGIARLRNGYAQTLFDQFGQNFKVDTSYILDSKGEKVGHVEVVSVITNLVAASQYEKKAVDKLSTYLEKMADGQLGFDIEALPESDENTKDVKENFVTIMDNLEKAREMLKAMIANVIENSKNVSQSSIELSMASQQAGQATSQIATTMQQVAKGVTQQSEATAKVTSMVENEVSAINDLVEGTKKQGVAVKKAGEVTNLITSTGGISDKVLQSNKKVEEMGERSNKIGAIVETIDDIASQTNLLALNAAIEAARAGEQGKGFAVVADEVRKLAERSSVATKEIGSLIDEIQKTVQEAVVVSTSAAQEINLASIDLMDSIAAVANVVKENEVITEKLAESSNEVMKAIENIAAVSEESSAAVEEVSASSEEMTAQVEEVNASAQSLSDMAEILRESTDKFTL
jgi:methyl-accepting chemotaxis protein